MPIKVRKFKLRSFLMILSNGITALIILLLFFSIYSSTSGFMCEMAASINRSEFEYILSSVESQYNEVMNITRSIGNNEKLKELMSIYNSEGTDINSKISAVENVTDILEGLRNSNKLIKSINIVTEKRRYITLDYLISMDEAIRLSEEHFNEPVFCYPKVLDNVNNLNSNYLIKDISKEIYIKLSLFDDNNFYGNAYVLLYGTFFREIASGRENILIYDNKNTVLYDSLKILNLKSGTGTLQQFVETLEDQKDYAAFKRTLDNGWTVVYLANRRGFAVRQKTLNIIMLCLLAASFLCSAFLSNYLSKSVLRPVYSLVQFMAGYKYESNQYNRYEADTSKRKRTLREKIFYYLTSTIMLPVLLFIVMYYFQTMHWVKIQISDQYSDTFVRTARYVERYFESKESVFQNVIYNVAMQEYIFKRNNEDMKNAIEVMRNYKYLGLGNDEISIYNGDKTLFFSNYANTSGYLDDKALNMLNGRKQGFLWDNSRDELNNQVYVLLTKISPISGSVASSSERVVYARLRIPSKDIESIFGNLKASTPDVIIADSRGKDVFNESSDEVFKENLHDASGRIEAEWDGMKYMVFYQNLSNTPWYLIAKYNYRDISSQSSSIIASNVYIMIIMLLFIVVLSYFISLVILKPINIFNNILERYRLDDIDADMVKHSFINEIDSLGINFNKMIERIEDLFDDLLIANQEKNQLKLQIKAAEMVALQAQINPHFLYNTLDNLMYLIDTGHKQEARQVVSSLSKLFRFGISRGDRIIAISEEIAYARAYAEIIRIRYGNGISFIWDIDESLQEYKTLKLILQPLIENAVFHGFRNMNEGCVVSVRCSQQSDIIRFIVSDNGEGIHEEKLDEIREDLKAENVDEKIGIFNVQARIRLQYGKDFGLHIESRREQGTTVTISIPKDEEGVE